MSEKFTQIDFPCLECLVKVTCKQHPNIKEEDFYPMMLAFKKWNEKEKCYRKGLLECWVNMGRKVIDSARDKDCNFKPQSVNPAYLDFILSIIEILEYIIHSSSWKAGEKHNFDTAEIQRKFDLAKMWIKSSGRFP